MTRGIHPGIDAPGIHAMVVSKTQEQTETPYLLRTL